MLALTMLGAAAVAAPTRTRDVLPDLGDDTVDPRGALSGGGRPLRVFVLGLRGFPSVEGGVESHAQNLCPRLVDLGCEVEVAVRSPYVSRADAGSRWRGVRFRRLWAPRLSGHEAAVHSLLAVLVAGVRRPDIVHVHAIGSSMWVPLARALGLKVVVTHHSLDYEREKWGRVAKNVLRFGEYAGMRFANERIAISRPIAELMPERHGVPVRFIPNGVELPELGGSSDRLARFGLAPHRYILCVGRLTPEKRQLDLIRAFSAAKLDGWKLAIVGGISPGAYTDQVMELAASTPGVVCTGFQSGEDLRQLFAHAGGFALPSAYEGLSIALLEALSFGLPVTASDIPGNRAAGLDESCYFQLGDVDALADRLRELAARPITAQDRERRRAFVRKHFDWDVAAVETLETYRRVFQGQPALRLVREVA